MTIGGIVDTAPPARMAGIKSGTAVVKGTVVVNPIHPHTPAHGTVVVAVAAPMPATAVALSELLATAPNNAHPCN